MSNITREDIRNASPGLKRLWAREGLVSARKYVYLAVAIFVISTAIGLTYSERFQSALEIFKKVIGGRFEDKNMLVTILLIFAQNFLATFISAFLGVLLGFIPALSAISNGILLGVVISGTAGSDHPARLLLLIPHGIFELPAVMIAWGLGIWHGAWIFRKDKSETLRNRRLKVSLAFFRYSVPLLIIAAIVEGIMMKR